MTHEDVFFGLVDRKLRNTLAKLTPEGKPYVHDYVVLYDQKPNCAVLYSPKIPKSNWQFGKYELHLNDTKDSWRQDIFEKIKPALGEGRPQKTWILYEVADWNRLALGLGLKPPSPPAAASQADAADEPQSGKDWSPNEVRLIVADYFDMLKTELQDKPYSKADHRKALAPQLSQRSKGSIEFKHQNISSILVDLGMPYIEGYKPRGNYQGILATEVESFLEQHADFFERLASAPLLNPTKPKPAPQVDLESVIEDPPEKILAAALGKPWLSRRGRKIDFAERDALNRNLGRLGEQFVVEYERHRLTTAGRDDLAAKVVWASRDIGDGLGFDIISHDESDESERMLEVKTTGLGKYFPFCVTSTEVRCSEDIPQQYHLFRVFDFGRSPRVYILHGSLRVVCRLEPVMFRALI